MNIPTAWAITLSAALLAGCANQEALDEYPQKWFITATQENINWVPTTIEIFEAWTTNNPNDCIRNDIAKWVADLLKEWDDRETIDACFFSNK